MQSKSRCLRQQERIDGHAFKSTYWEDCEPLDVPMTADAIPIANDQDRAHIEDYLKHPDHKAYAVKSMPPIASFSRERVEYQQRSGPHGDRAVRRLDQ